MPKPLPTLKLGHKLQGRYRILRKLASGGFGSVYLADDTRLRGRHVAIKELSDPAPAAQRLFQQEAVVLASLSHPGLVRVSDFFAEGRSHYLVMDYIEGQDLLELAIEAEKGRELLPVDLVTQWMLQVCDAVAYLHAQVPPIVHRDIKPNNIRLSKSGQAILVDFGIAKVDPKAKTEMMAKAVSEGYSPPEQYAGPNGTDTRSDVYALGATLYCLLTVKPPPDSFQRLTRGARLTPPRRINPDVDKVLQDVVVKAMALAASQRYQDAGEMLDALYEALGQEAGRKPIKRRRTAARARDDRATGEICPKCGNRARLGARFCPKCGERLALTQVQPRREARRRCARCGAENRTSARFCARCRARLTP